MGRCYGIALIFQRIAWIEQWKISGRMKQLSKPFKKMWMLVCTHILFYYYILFFENKKVRADEQLHFSEQLVYKEYLNKMQFEVARMQFEAILSKAILYEVQF